MTTLDELRKANLQEQRRSAQTASETASAAPAPAASAAPAVPEPVVQAAPVVEARPVAPDPARAAPRVYEANGHAALPLSAPATAPVGVPGDLLAAAVRKRLARRTTHQTGVKATVDMPPELFWRLKRYCRDNNNITVRQVMLDLLIAYLDNEDY